METVPMRILITGANGFVGQHLIHELLLHKHEPIAFDLSFKARRSLGYKTFVGDIRNADLLKRIISRSHPDACVHLGALTFVPKSWADPGETFAVNLMGTVNLLNAARAATSSLRLLVISSSEIYGWHRQQRLTVEENGINPDNPYAVSKAAADLMTLAYAHQYGMQAMTARPSNHIGPGQSPRFVVASFAQQLLAISRKQAPAVINVGNLESKRDFTDVRDIVRAYRLLIEKGRPGQAYNIASGREITIRSILEKLMEIIGTKPVVKVEPRRFRAESRPLLDTTKIKTDVHWQPEIPVETTLRDIVTDLKKAPRPRSRSRRFSP